MHILIIRVLFPSGHSDMIFILYYCTETSMASRKLEKNIL